MQSSRILAHDNMPFVSVAVYKKGVSNHCFNQINKLYPNSSIYIICPKKDIILFKSLELENTVIIDEDVFIDGINKQFFLNLFNFDKKYFRKTWYWQQILKLFCCENTIIPETYVIIDSDFIILNKIKFLKEDKFIFNQVIWKWLWDTDKYYYSKFIKEFVGVNQVKYGYISEYMIFEKKYVKEMIAIFGNNNYDIVNNLLITLRNEKYDLSEYLWYANFMFKNYPNKVITQSIYYYRLCHLYYGHSIRKYELLVFKKIWKLDAICVEPWEKHFLLIAPIYKFISYLRYKFNYYGRLPFSVIPKKDPAWVYNIPPPLIIKISLKYPFIRTTYRSIRKIYCSIYKSVCSK